MSQKVRLAPDTSPIGVIGKCVSCLNTIAPGTPIYRDLDSDDDLCTTCAEYFVSKRYAVIVPDPYPKGA